MAPLYCIMLRRGIHFYLVLSLFAIYLVNGIIAISKNSLVYDEMDNWSYSRRIMKGHPEIVYPYDDGPAMPIGILNTIPRSIQQITNPGMQKTDGGFSDVMNGRYVTLLVCLFIGVFIYKWSKELFGQQAGLLSLFMFVFCPNLNANSILLSFDAYTALFTLTSFYYFWKFVKASGYINFICFSTGFALAQISKYSSIHLLIIFGILSLIVLVKRGSVFSNWKKNLLRFVILTIISLTIINAAYLFQGSGKKLDDYGFRSSIFKSFQSIPVLSIIPMPLPAPYVEGFDITFEMVEIGPGNPNVAGRNYLLGEFNTTGTWYFYLAIILFKTPLSYIAAFVLLAFIYLNRKRFPLISAEFFIGFGLLYFFVAFSFLNSIQNSLRHVLFIYPLLYVLIGRVVHIHWKKSFKNTAAFVFVVYTLASFYFYFPNLISYSNELIIDKKNAYKIMADCNLDYDQGRFALEKYLRKHPDVKIADRLPQTGKVVIGLNDYVDIYGTGRYNWLKNYKPVAHINHCYLLLEIR